MKVEVSAENAERINELVASGEYPDVDAVLDAALDVLEPAVWDTALQSDEEDALDAEADADIEAGRTRPVDDAYLADLRERANAIISKHSPRG